MPGVPPFDYRTGLLREVHSHANSLHIFHVFQNLFQYLHHHISLMADSDSITKSVMNLLFRTECGTITTMAKLTYEQSAELVTKYVAGKGIMELATEFGLWPSGVISRLKTAKVYKVDHKLVAENEAIASDEDILMAAFNDGRKDSTKWSADEVAAYDRLKEKGAVE